MAHLNLDLDFFGHRKTKRLVGLLSRGAEVLPLRLWCYCGKYHSEDGRLAGYTAQEIESIVEWWGKPGEAVKAMLSVIFLEQEEDGTYVVHGWLEMQGHIAALRERNKKNAQTRWSKVRDACQPDATGMQGKCSLPSDPSKPSPPLPPPEFFDLIDESLRIPEFIAAWRDWVQHRHERKPAVKETAARRQLEFCRKIGVERAIIAINHSIAGSYQGIFEPRQEGGMREDPKQRARRLAGTNGASNGSH